MAERPKDTIHIKLFNSDTNKSVFGILTLEVLDSDRSTAGNWSGNSSTAAEKDEIDPRGAAMYVIVVVLVYGLSIIFLIGSHVFYKRRQERAENDNERLVAKYLEEAPALRESSARESFRKLKRSLIPVVAESNAKELLFKSTSKQSYLSLLNKGNAVLGRRLSAHVGDDRASPALHRDTVSPGRILPAVTFNMSEHSAPRAKPIGSPSILKHTPTVHRNANTPPAISRAARPSYLRQTDEVADVFQPYPSENLPGIVVTPSRAWEKRSLDLRPVHDSKDRSNRHVSATREESSQSTESESIESIHVELESEPSSTPSQSPCDSLGSGKPKFRRKPTETCYPSARLSGTFLEVPPYHLASPSTGSVSSGAESDCAQTEIPENVEADREACDPFTSISVKTACVVVPPMTSTNVTSKMYVNKTTDL